MACQEREDRKCMLLGFHCVRCDPLMSRGSFDGSEWGTNELGLSMAGLYSVLLMARTVDVPCKHLSHFPGSELVHGGLTLVMSLPIIHLICHEGSGLVLFSLLE